MLKRNIFIVAIIILTTAFAANTFGQSSKRGKTSKPKANVQSPTTQKPKTPKSRSDRFFDFYDPAGTLVGVEDRAKPKDYESSARKTNSGTKVTSGTIPVYKNGKNSAKRSRTPVKNSFQSQTQPFADGRVKGKTKSSRQLPTNQVQNLEQTNGGMDTADEKPEFNQRNAKPKDLVNKNSEAKPALLEFQIPEKIVSDNKHPEGQYSRKATDSRKSNPKPKRTTVRKPKEAIRN